MNDQGNKQDQKFDPRLIEYFYVKIDEDKNGKINKSELRGLFDKVAKVNSI